MTLLLRRRYNAVALGKPCCPATSIRKQTGLTLIERCQLIALIACVVVTLCMARGPLFQKATTIRAHRREIRGNMTLNVAQELSNNLASAKSRWFGTKGLDADLLSVIRDAPARLPIKINNTGCASECETRINVCFA